MSIEAELSDEFDRWERKENATFKVLPYFLLSASVIVTLLQPLWHVPVHLPAVLGLSLAAGLWLLWFHTLHPEWHANRPLMGLNYTGLMVLAAGLVAIAPWYGFFTFIGYPLAFQYLDGRWRYAGAAATATISAAAFMGGVASIDADNMWLAWVAVSAVSTVLSGALFYFAEMANHRNDKQRQALVELRKANDKLEDALAENAGLHAQLLVQAREAGVMDERQRMAREIHDTLAQGLAGIITQLQAAEQTLGDPPKLSKYMSNAMNLARESLTEARRTVHAVQPAVLAESRLPDAISDVARRWSEVNGIDAVLTTTGDARPMHADVEVTLLRTAQEALANVAKHARASRVGLTLSYMEDLVSIDVRDDGVGFDPNAKRANGSTNGGFGLAGMRQRVQRLAGQLDIESEPGGGTAISASVPAIPAGGGK
ncbi:two-component sensor histidine kinase [Actinosynnema sp. ALI-1.44]|uniref:sensor histidine kinase n=1 Tax=Actinosynnema sp. ALI-1.44 TaxID=1933779 RepID=UPI00097C09F0|nr:sensor histidine kinase [Actinosynnema sp. ALI-1.44]ONI75395.1 two-component sensor histidine kinase [Actinosynnema sp. ALI-1.44]